ncbi:MAG: hypothetical protein JW776_04170 [Candidatus Lokiarchaeota archaeon]|nr:hypothetical protein [Candidatus Lokiarchaeota archaeon]
MSEQPKSEGSLKKQLISLGIIVVLVVGGWYLSAVVSEAIFQRGKYVSVDILGETPFFPTDNTPISPPNFTPPDDWSGFDPSLLDLLAGLPFLAGALGNFTDLEQFNTVAFRVYAGSATTLQDDNLWRYSAYDEYQSNGWARSVEYNYPLDQNWNSGLFANEYQIRVPYGSEQQIAIALPSVFPYPAVNNFWLEPGTFSSQTLNIDSQNGSSITFTQQDAVEGNLTYTLYGNNPTPEDQYQNNCDVPANAPQIIKNQYLQFPNGGKVQYAADKPSYQNAVSTIEGIILSLYGYMGNQIPYNMRTYDIVEIIRTYLEDNFSVDMSFPFERPGSGDDVVEWFLSRGSGLPMDFAAAFVMLCRWFEVPCRYAAGYNSKYTSDEYDPYWNGGTSYRDIRMVNMDAWNEVFMPMTGGFPSEFTPILLTDVSFPPPPSNGTTGDPINILINGTYSTQSLSYRGFDVEITAELPSGAENEPITFYDHTTEENLAQLYTNSFGRASYIYSLDNSITAGAHFISVQATIFQRNACAIILDDEVQVMMTSLNPTVINRATENETQVIAYIYDPENGNRVKNAILHPVVVQGGTAISDSIAPPNDAIKVDDNGAINKLVTISEYVSQGSYTFRVDFNGTYSIIDPITGQPQEITIPGGLIDDSSNALPFTIIDDNQKIFDLYVDSGSVGEDTAFYKTRGVSIDFDVYLRQGLVDVSGGIVEIRDRTYDDFLVATLITAIDGTASTTYSLSTDYAHWVAGVHELYGIWTNGGGRLNQSYYLIVDEPLTIQITNTPGPTVDRTGGTSELQVQGILYDADPLVMSYSRYGWMSVLLRHATTLNDYTSVLTGDIPYFNSPTGTWTRNHGVQATTPLGNYEVYAAFNGNWELPNGFTVSDASFYVVSAYNLITIIDPSDINIEFEIDGTPTQTTYFGSSAPSYTRYQTVNLYARIWQGGINPSGVAVNFYDETTGTQIGSTQYTNGWGEVTLPFTLGNSWTAGLNKISVAYGTNKNYSQIYLNAPMQVYIVSSPPTSGVRVSDQMIISGVIRDSLNLNPVKGAEVRLDVYDGATDKTDEITTWVSPSTGRYTFTSQSDGTFQILWRMPIHFQFNYDVSVTFTGFQQDLSPECQANYNNPAQASSSGTYVTQVIAGVELTAEYSPHPFVMGQPVWVRGYLTYDNGTAIVGESVTITFYDSGDNPLHTNTVTTNGAGNYTYSPTLTWQYTDTIYVEYAGGTAIDGTSTQAAYIP